METQNLGKIEQNLGENDFRGATDVCVRERGKEGRGDSMHCMKRCNDIRFDSS